MKGFSGLAALALLAATTGAHAQGGPVNHKGSASESAPAPGMMAPPPPLPGEVASSPPDLAMQLSQVRATLSDDLAQRRIGRRRATHLRRELKTIEVQAGALDARVAKIAASLP